MKQSLHFLSEQEFQSFFGQLSSAEISNFQAVESAGGDMGFDGLSGTIAYQVYYPEEKNRTDAKFIDKIDRDTAKVLNAKNELGIEITDWIFVVPEDLRIKVVAHLQKLSEKIGLNCTYWGATKLTELITKYPYIRNSFPGIFLPDIKEDLSDVKDKLISLSIPRTQNSFNVEIMTDKEFEERDKAIDNEYRQQSMSVTRQFGRESSAHIAADAIHRQKANQNKKDLRLKKEASDRAYELEKQEIEDWFSERVDKIRESFAIRGLGGSGLESSYIGKAEAKKNRELEKLKLKYGKE